MSVQTSLLSRCGLALLVLSTSMLGLSAQAASKQAPPSAPALYLHQRAQCATQRPVAERADCFSEARTAYAATQPSLPGDDADSLLHNKLIRCEPLRGADQRDCLARMRGEGTVSGSVASGGIYRELVTIVPDVPAPTADAVPVSLKPQ